MTTNIDPTTVLPFPSISVVLNDDQPHVDIAGTQHPLEGRDLDQLRDNARRRITKTAEALGRPVQAIAHEPGGNWSLIIHPDGTVQDGPALPTIPKARRLFRRRSQ